MSSAAVALSLVAMAGTGALSVHWLLEEPNALLIHLLGCAQGCLLGGLVTALLCRSCSVQNGVPVVKPVAKEEPEQQRLNCTPRTLLKSIVDLDDTAALVPALLPPAAPTETSAVQVQPRAVVECEWSIDDYEAIRKNGLRNGTGGTPKPANVKSNVSSTAKRATRQSSRTPKPVQRLGD